MQHDMDVANQGFGALRADLNNALQALVSNNSGATAPATTFAYQWWADTTAGILKQRNAANSAWVSVLNLATGMPVGAAASGANTDITSLGALQSINGGQIAGLRNKIINGAMEVAQRGTSVTGIAGSTTYVVDRWCGANNSAAVYTLSQQADAPGNNEFQYSTRFAVTTADASIGAGDIAVVSQRIEGYNVRDLIGKTFTLSFFVRSSKTGIHCASFRNSGTDRSYVVEYTVNAANTWEFKTVTVTGGLVTAGTWNWTNGVGLYVGWSLAAGSTFQTTAGAWQTGNFQGTANQVNCLDTIGNIFAITGVQLEVGSVATPFEHRPFGMELTLCQRYFAKTFSYGVAPAQNSGNYGGVLSSLTGATSFTGNCVVNWRYPQPMRTSPTINAFTPGASGTACFSDSGGGTIAASATNTGETSTTLYSSGGGMNPNSYGYVHATADAEL